MRLEILNRISGVTFADCYGNRLEVEVDGVPIMVIRRDDLIANQLASERDKDLGDVRKLTKGAVNKRSQRNKESGGASADPRKFALTDS